MLLGETGSKGQTSRCADADATVPAAITDTGCERTLNEDRYAVIESPSGVTWMVCDGMGGATGGELAAQLVIDAARRDLETLPARNPELAMRSALQEANRVIVLRRQNKAFAQMGTTVVSAVFDGSEVVIGHVGDSRAYLVRDVAIQQLTTDHTYVQQLVDKGQIKPEEALSHPQAHILTRCLGSEPALEIDISRFWIWPCEGPEPEDYLLLCTDGLYSLVAEGEMANIITKEAPQDACVKLVELAKVRGGFDNITLAIIPLKGQLRREPPEGFEKKRQARHSSRQKAMMRAEPEPSNLGKLLIISTMLSILAALLTVLFVTLSISR